MDRGTAVKQQSINRGYKQNLESPTLNPMMMKQSLDQTDDLREKAEIAYAHGNLELANMYLKLDEDDTALLAAEAAQEQKDVDYDTPGAIRTKLKSDLRAMNTSIRGVVETLTMGGNVEPEQALKSAIGMAVETLPPAQVMADPQVRLGLEGIVTAMNSNVDSFRGTMGIPTPEEARDKFIKDAMVEFGFNEQYREPLAGWWHSWQRKNKYTSELPGDAPRQTENQQPDGIQPPEGMN
jgi:hypothetical protein